MATSTMSGAEFAGRVFALEALVIALASEMLAELPEDKVAGVFAGVRAIARDIVDELSPKAGATPAIVKEIERNAEAYVDGNIDAIRRGRARILKQASGA